MEANLPNKRILALDILRGLAVLLMVMMHIVLDVYWFLGIRWYYDMMDFWNILGRTAALTFFVVFGISAVLASNKYHGGFVWYCLKRALLLLGFALLITLATSMIKQIDTIFFGVLHFLGVSALLLPLVVRLRYFSLVLAAGSFWLGDWLYHLDSTDHWLYIFGTYTTPNLGTADWYPLFPWFGFILLGVFVGHHLHLMRFFTGFTTQNAVLLSLALVGRHALLIYVLHQPLLVAALLIHLRLNFG